MIIWANLLEWTLKWPKNWNPFIWVLGIEFQFHGKRKLISFHKIEIICFFLMHSFFIPLFFFIYYPSYTFKLPSNIYIFFLSSNCPWTFVKCLVYHFGSHVAPHGTFDLLKQGILLSLALSKPNTEVCKKSFFSNLYKRSTLHYIFDEES